MLCAPPHVLLRRAWQPSRPHPAPRPPQLPLEEARSRISQFASEREWGEFHTPRNLLLALVGEVRLRTRMHAPGRNGGREGGGG